MKINSCQRQTMFLRCKLLFGAASQHRQHRQRFQHQQHQQHHHHHRSERAMTSSSSSKPMPPIMLGLLLLLLLALCPAGNCQSKSKFTPLQVDSDSDSDRGQSWFPCTLFSPLSKCPSKRGHPLMDMWRISGTVCSTHLGVSLVSGLWDN